MPKFTFVTSIAAGATANPLSGWQYEYLPFAAVVKVLVNTTATGVLITAFSGAQTVQEETPVSSGGVAGTLPSTLNQDPIVFEAPAGDRLKLNIRNTTAGALTVSGVVDVIPAM
jgi:hypothetical protein